MSTITARITWRRSTTTEDGFRVYRDTQPIDLNNLPEPYDILGPGSVEYVDTNVTRGQVFYYRIGVIKDDIERVSKEFIFSPETIFTGPGPNTLIGNNDTAGFFGEVPVEELIDGEALADLIGLTDGTAQNSTAPWLKFFIDDRIVYVPKMTYRHSISWNHINTVDAVFGDRVITIGGYQYRIGLLKGLGSDTSEFATGTYDNPATHGSEWNRLLYNVSEEHTDPVRHKHSQIGENWASYSQDELNITSGYGLYNWCQETNPLNTSQRVWRGRYAVSYLTSVFSSTANANYGWRPRLELITV